MRLRCRLYLLEGKFLEKFKERHGIVSRKAHSRHSSHSIGFSEKEKRWYGWSHRAIESFGLGDRIFEPGFGNDATSYRKHGKVKVKSMADAEKSARVFARYVS